MNLIKKAKAWFIEKIPFYHSFQNRSSGDEREGLIKYSDLVFNQYIEHKDFYSISINKNRVILYESILFYKKGTKKLFNSYSYNDINVLDDNDEVVESEIRLEINDIKFPDFYYKQFYIEVEFDHDNHCYRVTNQAALDAAKDYYKEVQKYVKVTLEEKGE